MSTSPATNHARQDFVIAPMTEHDLLDVVEIEEHSGLSRWGWGAYYAELQGPNRSLMLVARPLRESERHNVGIIGYIVARLGAGDVHINNVAVRDAFRRRGIGSILLTQIINEARKNSSIMAFLEVRAGNEAAQALYQKCGFRPIGRRSNYYSTPVEDALVMSLKL